MRVSLASLSLLAIGTISSVTASPLSIPDILDFLKGGIKGGDKKCKKPEVRPEWRQMSKRQQEAWVAATIVRLLPGLLNCDPGI